MVSMDGFGEFLKENGKKAVDAAKEAAAIARIKTDMKAEELKMNNTYVEIGKLFCSHASGEIDEVFIPLLQKIADSKEKLINFEAELDKLKKTVIILTLNKKAISHVHQIMNMIQNIAIARRDLIFAYLDIEEDVSLITFFKIKNFIDESVIVYNFEIGKYYLDNYKDEMRIKDIIEMIDRKEIQWKSGYFIEDFLNSFGVSVDRKYIIFITFVVMAIIAIAVTMCICNVINIVDNKFKKE